MTIAQKLCLICLSLLIGTGLQLLFSLLILLGIPDVSNYDFWQWVMQIVYWLFLITLPLTEELNNNSN